MLSFDPQSRITDEQEEKLRAHFGEAFVNLQRKGW